MRVVQRVIGVDGGGSKTIALLADRQGKILGSADAGPSNYQVLGLEGAAANIADAVSPLLVSAASNRTAVQLVVGVAGAGRTQDRRRLTRMLIQRLEQTAEVYITTDAHIALVGAVGGNYGVAINAGTGAIAVGLNINGQFARADGWGYVLGDEGSGYWIGLEATRAALRAYDGRGGNTVLEKMVREHYDIEKLSDLVEETRQHKLSPSKVSKLVPRVFEAAKTGDGVAANILAEAGRRLGRSAKTVIQQLKMESEEFGLALVGGVFRNADLGPLMQGFEGAIAQVAPRCRMVCPRFSPEIGAVLLGLSQCQGEVSDEVLENLADYGGKWREGNNRSH